MDRFNWDYIRHRYVTGGDEITLELLSKEPNMPSLATLKKKSSSDFWADQRKQYRYQAVTLAAETQAGQDAIRKLEEIQKLVDAAEMITRHLQLARAIQGVATQALKDKLITAADLNPRDLLAWLQQGITLERMVADMATEHVKVQVDIDVSSLSDEQLQRIAAGEDPAKVIQLNHGTSRKPA